MDRGHENDHGWAEGLTEKRVWTLEPFCRPSGVGNSGQMELFDLDFGFFFLKKKIYGLFNYSMIFRFILIFIIIFIFNHLIIQSLLFLFLGGPVFT